MPRAPEQGIPASMQLAEVPRLPPPLTRASSTFFSLHSAHPACTTAMGPLEAELLGSLWEPYYIPILQARRLRLKEAR